MRTPQHARAFARNGFLHLRSLVDAATCRALVERTCTVLPASWRRDDPRTWSGPVADSCHDAPLEHRAGLLKYQLRDLAADPHVLATYQPPSPVHDLAHALIGRPLHRIRVRGLYAIAPAPRPDLLPHAPRPHVEAHAAHIVASTAEPRARADARGVEDRGSASVAEFSRRPPAAARR